MKVGDLAKKLNLSKATVSKTMRHCGGVDSATRQLILDEANRCCFEGDISNKSACSVYSILPDIPKYFWGELYRGIFSDQYRGGITVRHNIYTKIGDSDTVLDYLNCAELDGAGVLIIAAQITPEIHARLSELAKSHMVILLSEYHELEDGFYIGSDSAADGYAMGKLYLESYSEKQLILLSMEKNINAELRTAGFTKAVNEADSSIIKNAVKISIESGIFSDSKVLPSRLASILSSEIVSGGNEYCIYAPTGMIQLPLAIYKAKLDKSVCCLCHDSFAESQLYNVSGAVCSQDVYAQGEAAIRAAAEFILNGKYPPQRTTYIPSSITHYN